MANDIVTTGNGQIQLQQLEGELRIDHRIVAEGLGFVNTANKKAATNWRRFTLEKYESQLSQLGVCLKHTLDNGTIVWYLSESQANFAGTLSRNTEKAIEFKLALIKEFEKAKAQLALLSHRDQIVKACVLPQPTPWQKRFEADYYDQLSRFTGLVAQGHKRPALWGALTKELVYDYLPEGVTEALMTLRREEGSWQKLHQFLSPDGYRAFENHMRSVQNFMIAASSLDDLRRLLRQSATRSYQLLLF